MLYCAQALYLTSVSYRMFARCCEKKLPSLCFSYLQVDVAAAILVVQPHQRLHSFEGEVELAKGKSALQLKYI